MYIFQISDFGLSKFINSHMSSSAKHVVGTVTHMAPECWDCVKPNGKMDIYGYGIIIWEVLTRKRACNRGLDIY